MIVGVVALLAAQQAAAPPSGSLGLRNYQRARAVLEAGVEAIGGRSALLGVRTVYRSIHGGWVGNGQVRAPVPDTTPTLLIQPYVFNDRVSSHIDYDAARWTEQLDQASSDSPGDRIRVTEAVTSEAGFQSLTYYEEPPLLRRHEPDDLASLVHAKLRRYPEGSLRMALQRSESLQWVDRGAALGREDDVISFTDPTGVRVLLYFDAETHLLTMSETLSDDPAAGDSHRDIVYLAYHAVGPLRLPTRLVVRAAGVPTEEHFVDSAALNVPLPDAAFRPPTDAVSMAGEPSSPTLQALADGLYLVRGPYNSVVAEFEDHLVLFEAPLGSAHMEAVLALIRDALPAKPVRYLVASHFHPDHVAGIRPLVARGVTILTTADAVPVIARVVSSRRTMRPDTVSRSPTSPRTEVIRERRVLKDAANTVELYEVGPTPHVAQILVAYFPRQRTLVVADLVDISSTALLLVGPDAVPLWEKIRSLGWEVQQIIPVHGVPGTLDMLARAIALRAKYVGSP